MFCEKSLELIKEVDRMQELLPSFNENGVRQVLDEMKLLYEQNQRDIPLVTEGDTSLLPSVHIRHSAFERNKRCLLAYLFHRLQRVKQMRWEFGSVLPQEIKFNLSEPELHWFQEYSKTLANYMRSIGEGHGLDLTQDTVPPKSLYVEVRVLQDFGELLTDDGDVVVLTKGNQLYLPRQQCEHLVRIGVLEQVA